MNIKISKELKKELIEKYRTEIFETDDIDINEINDLISDDELVIMFGLNLSDMLGLINKKPIDKDSIRKLFIANVNFYKIAKKRDVTLYGSSFLMKIATVIDYDINKLYDELNVGAYNNKFGKR